MTDNRELHVQRLIEAKAKIPEWKAGPHNPFAPEFTSWQQRVEHSLTQLFGRDHHYRRAFSMLSFWETRMSMGRGLQVRLGNDDDQRYVRDMDRTDAILHDALQELPTLPARANAPTAQPAERGPAIVVNVLNVLSQSTVVSQEQIVREIESLSLTPEAKTEAVRTAADLAAEVRGEQRWPVMAKSLDVLKKLGKGVYEKVALPLLLEVIKKQSGLD